MKKVYLLSAVLATLFFVSCERENFGNGGNLGQLSDDGIAFVFDGVQTKSADMAVMSETPSGVSFKVGDTPGTSFTFTETVTNLNAYGPMTKGAPIYKENITSVAGYKSVDVVTYLKNGALHSPGNALFDYMAPQGEDTGLYYAHSYPTSPWPSDFDQDLYFFLRMPATDSNLTNPEYDSAEGKIEFDYEAYGTASAQKDILFASRTLNKNQYRQNYASSGAPITFYHALTGVRFRTGSDNDGTTKTIITKVEFKNLYSKGHGVYNPDSELFTWTVDEDSEADFSLSIAPPTYEEGYSADVKDNTVNYVKPEGEDAQPALGDSWYNEKYNTNNLNDAAGSMTFWLIPQAFEGRNDVTLEVTFRVCTPSTPEGTEITHEISLGKILGEAGIEWKSGQLRTYTLDPKDVDVDIFDTMDSGSDASGSYLIKENLRVTNTGNVKEYVRMLVSGNWYGWESEEAMATEDPKIIVGYKYSGAAGETIAEGDNIDTMADYWSATHSTYGQGFDSSFTGGKVPSTSKWRRGTSGYYYTEPLGPGSALSAETTPLFDYYKFYDEWTPTLYIPDPETGGRKAAVGVHLVMEVVVQAIGAEDANGEEFEDCWAAWSNATGLQITEKEGYIQ